MWCHNPESQSFKPELYYLDEKCVLCGLCKACPHHVISEKTHVIIRENCTVCGKCVSACLYSALEVKGSEMTALDVLAVVLKDKKFYVQSSGGLTLSGGEPLAQFNFTRELLRLAKENGIHTCLETSGYAPADRIQSILPYVDLFLYDFKESDNERHKDFTGASNDSIIDNLFAIDEAGAKIILRCPIIPSCNDRDDHFSSIAKTANALKNIMEINIMPYHPMGASKAQRIGRKKPVADMGFPSDGQIGGWIQSVSKKTDIPVNKG
jgi:pyruvate formate lyase activating enzyme